MLLLSQYTSTWKSRLYDNRQTIIYAEYANLSGLIRMYSIALDTDLLQMLCTTLCQKFPASLIIVSHSVATSTHLSFRWDAKKSHTALQRNGSVLCMLQPMTNVRETDTQEADGAPAASQKANFQERSMAWIVLHNTPMLDAYGLWGIKQRTLSFLFIFRRPEEIGKKQ